MKKVFTLFYGIEKYHKYKDVGLFGASIANNLSADHEFLDTRSNSLIRFLLSRVGVKGDRFILYSFGKLTIINVMLIRLFLGRSSKIIVKLDYNEDKKGDLISSNNRSYKRIVGLFLPVILKLINVLCVESEKSLVALKSRNPNGNFQLVRNWTDFTSVKNFSYKATFKVLYFGNLCEWYKNRGLLFSIVSDERLSHLSFEIFTANHDLFRLKNSENIKICAYVNSREHLRKVYQEGSILLLPSVKEGLPLVIPEALSQGVYPLSSNFSAVEELINEFGFGEVMRTHDKNSWVEKILELETLFKNKKLNTQKYDQCLKMKGNWDYMLREVMREI